MRVRDHVFLSTSGAIILAPWLRRRVLVPWAASILIDVDHYLWYCAHERSLSPRRAVRYFTGPEPGQGRASRRLHHPAVLLALLVLGARWRPARLLLLGMAFHVGLDTYHRARMGAARRAAADRDGGICQRCGAQGPAIIIHCWRQPPLLPAYRAEYCVSLCPACHAWAHAHAWHGGARTLPEYRECLAARPDDRDRGPDDMKAPALVTGRAPWTQPGDRDGSLRGRHI